MYRESRSESQYKQTKTTHKNHFFKFEASKAPMIIDPTAIPCATTLSLMRYLDVLMAPRNRNA